MARLTWVLAVAGLTTSRSEISSLDSPAATSPMTSRSRSVSWPSSRAGRGSRALAASAWPQLGRGAGLRGPGADPAHKPPGHPRREQGVAGGHGPDPADEVG